MSFASHDFLFLFLPFALAVVLTAEAIDRRRLLLPALMLVSAVFYGWGSIPHLILLVTLIAFTWTAARVYAGSSSAGLRGVALGMGILANIASLLVWKYGNSLVELWNGFGIVEIGPPSIIMPLGISFYAFQQIGYLLDIRRGRARPLAPLDYTAFVLFFPQLIAGPIVTERRMGREFASARAGKDMDTRLGLAFLGLAWFSIGLFKKTVLADGVARISAPLIHDASLGTISTLEAWRVAFAPATHVYFDFSGYSDMAVGLALLFGIRIPPNFNAPFRARTAREFWTRWHITFHQFVRDHLYGPLIRRLGKWRFGAALSLFLAILVSALWHGNSIQFMFWGIGLWLTVVGFGAVLAFLPKKLEMAIGRVIVFGILMFMGILFTVPDLDTALSVGRSMFVWQGGVDIAALVWLAVVVLAVPLLRQEISTQVLLESGHRHRERHVFGWRPPEFRANLGWTLVIAAVLLIAMRYVGRTPEFLYFGI